jgi:hypothetical protein
VIPVPPPRQLDAPHGLSELFLIMCTVIFAAFLGWCAWRAIRSKQPLPLFLLAGGLLATLIEPMLDNLGLLWFAKNNAAVAFHLFDRYLPLYVVLGYGFFFGGLSFLAYDGLKQGKSSSFLWRIYAAGWVFDMVIESVGHLSGLYKYYGPQPFNLWGVPLWWMFINPVLPVAAAALFFRLGDRLNGLRGALVIALLPMIYGGVYGGSSWPIFVALHSTDSRPVLWAAGAVTDVFALIMVWLSVLLATGSANAGIHAEDRLEVAAPALMGFRE